ncbi:molecular chaperone DnaJ [Venturia nashicola]|uniref:Molecular chaperone DnaJ n=1 Tax=Venturia nashicola TaxID=86259 RepID=A0A4Z1PG65_9PEZI|nr:molecular chaperone DnaJ [Venturia nashicola]
MFTTQGLPTSYYTTLNLLTTASNEEIRRSYRDLAKVLHPDKNPNDPKATSEFQLLQEAYSTLSDPLKRVQYDAQSRSSNTYHQAFNTDYAYAKFQDPRRFRPQPPPPKKPAPSPAEILLQKHREKEHRRSLRREIRSWEKFAEEFARKEKEKVKQRVKREGPIPEWLDNVVEAEGYVDGKEPAVMEGETLIDFEDDLIKLSDGVEVGETPRPVFPEGHGRLSGSNEAATAGSFGFEGPRSGLFGSLKKDGDLRIFGGLDPEASTFDPSNWEEDEFGRPSKRPGRRGSLGSRGRKACDEARRVNNLPSKSEQPASGENEAPTTDWAQGKTEWEIFFDQFETGLKV